MNASSCEVAPKKILLVEDDDAVHCALAEVLRGENYHVLHAFSHEDALLATQLERDIALVLLDLNLAGENGWYTFDRLTRTDASLPVVIITARSDQRAFAEAAGAAALMEKPLDFPRLLELIHETIARRRSVFPRRLANPWAEKIKGRAG
jgi:DNA-binding response OmpR family regulator